MRTITVKIPTSVKELRSMLKERSSKRYKHNAEVLKQFMQNIINEVESGYWSADISAEMKKRVFSVYNSGKIYEMYIKAKNNLK